MRTLNLIPAARVATACAAALVLAACGAPISTPVPAGPAQPPASAGTPPSVIRPASTATPFPTVAPSATPVPTAVATVTPSPVIRPTSTNSPLPSASPAPVSTTPGITGREWVLVEDSVHGRTDPAIKSTVLFADGRVSGSGGCNRISGSYTLSGNGLNIGPLASTKMACPGPSMTQEQWLSAALSKAVRYELAGNQLRIFYGDGRSVLTFAAQSAPVPQPSPTGATTGLLNRDWLLVEDSVHGRVPAGVKSTVRFSDGGKLGGNGGCNGFGGNYTVSGTNIKTDQLVSTLMGCMGPGGDQEQWYFAALGKAVRYELAGNQLRIFYGDAKAFLTFMA